MSFFLAVLDLYLMISLNHPKYVTRSSLIRQIFVINSLWSISHLPFLWQLNWEFLMMALKSISFFIFLITIDSSLDYYGNGKRRMEWWIDNLRKKTMQPRHAGTPYRVPFTWQRDGVREMTRMPFHYSKSNWMEQTEILSFLLQFNTTEHFCTLCNTHLHLSIFSVNDKVKKNGLTLSPQTAHPIDEVGVCWEIDGVPSILREISDDQKRMTTWGMITISVKSDSNLLIDRSIEWERREIRKYEMKKKKKKRTLWRIIHEFIDRAKRELGEWEKVVTCIYWSEQRERFRKRALRKEEKRRETRGGRWQREGEELERREANELRKINV